MNFVERQSSSDETFFGNSGPLVVRNIFRALQADIFTAFAFADGEGTEFLDHLKEGPNTLEDMGMGMMDLFHDEKRDEFFFWESEKPFKYVGSLLARNGPKSHERAQRWLMELVRPYEAKLQSRKSAEPLGTGLKQFSGGVYEKLLFHKNPKTGIPLDWTDRASEIMDHAGTRFQILAISTPTNLTPSRRSRRRTSRFGVHCPTNQHPSTRPIYVASRTIDIPPFACRGPKFCHD